MSQRSYRRLLRHGFLTAFSITDCAISSIVSNGILFLFQPICTDSTKSRFTYSVRHHYYYIAVIKAFGFVPVPLYQAAYRQATKQKTPFRHSTVKYNTLEPPILKNSHIPVIRSIHSRSTVESTHSQVLNNRVPNLSYQ